ncbi:MAG: Holliday junction branch migration protein RuvA [Gemmatimonadota bacterium]|nr:Holliday junction branch migration protein RuvA [Gemmatimonadota bacterium]
MIARVRGILAAVRDGRITVLTAAGTGYEIHVPLGVAAALPATGGEVDLHTALVVREDAQLLFGFASEADRELFLRLQGASGVGPRLALAILSALPARRVVSAIRGREPAVLQTVSGVGRKTAERLVLELADKLDELGDGPEVAGAARDGSALDALRALGYGAAEAETALAAAHRELPDAEPSVEDLVRAALRRL